ncbi:MAG: twin-arginine translocase TatA/TatE family subunit [Planctomycetia bacterium]|nr:twin-arginine translocase TatA/TatE family subunit [Planctomycetia bacterium]
MSPLLAIIGVGPLELAVVALVVLLLFGNRLPGLARSFGKSIVEFKRGVSGIEDDSEKGTVPPKN